ncbi:hypothetical protein PHLCEN_2v2513 [Hermanssonia centrifuga]|uniref:Uncharacterized protein n=1 Tax=Hermanssonia centrifuga TaxID=98765 RepID=A0A2R6RLN7_9APHY|nr:hypothetical protein PHLCEN_2v2513 [Hermanssonia centrifuga]
MSAVDLQEDLLNAISSPLTPQITIPTLLPSFPIKTSESHPIKTLANHLFASVQSKPAITRAVSYPTVVSASPSPFVLSTSPSSKRMDPWDRRLSHQPGPFYTFAETCEDTRFSRFALESKTCTGSCHLKNQCGPETQWKIYDILFGLNCIKRPQNIQAAQTTKSY